MTSYTVIEKTNTDYITKQTFPTIPNALEYITNITPIPTTILQTTTLSTITTDQSILPSTYIINAYPKIYLVSKVETIIPGYIYNTTTYTLNILKKYIISTTPHQPSPSTPSNILILNKSPHQVKSILTNHLLPDQQIHIFCDRINKYELYLKLYPSATIKYGYLPLSFDKALTPPATLIFDYNEYDHVIENKTFLSILNNSTFPIILITHNTTPYYIGIRNNFTKIIQ